MRWLAFAFALVVGCSAESPPRVEHVVPQSKPVATAPTVQASTEAAPCSAANRTHHEPWRKVSTKNDAYGNPLPEGAVARLGFGRMRAGGEIRALTFCGASIVVADRRGVVRAWDSSSGASRGAWRLTGEPVRAQCVEGKPHVITDAGVDALLDLTTGGSDVLELGDLSDAAASAQDDVRFLRRENVVRVCGGPTTLASIEGGLYPARLAHAGERLAGGTSPLTVFWDLAKPPHKTPPRSPIELLEWSNDDRRLLVAYEDHTVDIFGGDRVERKLDLGQDARASAMAANADVIAIGTHLGHLLRYETKTGAALPKLTIVREQMYSSIRALAFSEDGKQLAIGSDDHQVRLIAARATQAPSTDRPHGHQNLIWDAAFSPDGARIATVSSDASLRIWDAATGAEIKSLRATGAEDVRPMISVAWRSGALVASDDWGNYRRWNDRTFAREAIVKAPSIAADHLAVSGDRNVLATATEKSVWVFDSASFAVRAKGEMPKSGSTLPPGPFVLDQSGRRLAVCLEDEHAKLEILSIANRSVSPRPVFEHSLEQGLCPALAISPDGSLLATGLGELVSLAGKAASTFDTKNADALRFSPDGKLLAIAVGTELRIWDVVSGKRIRSFEGHDGRIFAIAWSPTGDRVVTTSEDLDALVWKL